MVVNIDEVTPKFAYLLPIPKNAKIIQKELKTLNFIDSLPCYDGSTGDLVSSPWPLHPLSDVTGW
jgi:hypothetical protein